LRFQKLPIVFVASSSHSRSASSANSSTALKNFTWLGEASRRIAGLGRYAEHRGLWNLWGTAVFAGLVTLRPSE